MTDVSRDAQRLITTLTGMQHVVVAFSGGVDSSVVAAAAARAKLAGLVAVTADSPSVPRWQLELAKDVAAEIGIEHRILATDEVERDAYRVNDRSRCFYCKETLYATLHHFLDERNSLLSPNAATASRWVIASGTNADDLGDYRPGIEAGKQADVRTPLAALGIGKAGVRRLAAYFGLSNSDLPASPCLASRIAYGTEVTVERLSRVERAEAWLRQRGFRQLRVRLHEGELARIEVLREQLPQLLSLDTEGELTQALLDLGFRFVTVDLQGLQSGSMNRVLVSLDVTAPGRPCSAESQEASL